MVDALSSGALPEKSNAAIIPPCLTGRGAVRLARLHGVQEVPGSIPGAPTGNRLHTICMDVSGLRSYYTRGRGRESGACSVGRLCNSELSMVSHENREQGLFVLLRLDKLQ